MILAGIDEAGLGPNVGPLITACAALRVPDDWRPDSPWDKLDAVFCRHWRKKETRLGVADSKILYTSGGLAALEKTLAAFVRLVGGADGIDFSVSAACAPGVGAEAEPHPCYSREPAPFPLYCARDEIDAAAERLADCLAANGAAAARLAVAGLYEPAMNRRFASGLNKNQILLMETGARLAALAEAFPDEPVLAVVDKQGGRNDYLPFLTALFPGMWLETARAGADESVYRVRRKNGALEIRFVAKGDRDSFATALASMAAKYARERAMAEVNRWFCERAPGLKETAGYPVDAKRWRGEVEEKADAGAVMLEKVWRVR